MLKRRTHEPRAEKPRVGAMTDQEMPTAESLERDAPAAVDTRDAAPGSHAPDAPKGGEHADNGND